MNIWRLSVFLVLLSMATTAAEAAGPKKNFSKNPAETSAPVAHEEPVEPATAPYSATPASNTLVEEAIEAAEKDAARKKAEWAEKSAEIKKAQDTRAKLVEAPVVKKTDVENKADVKVEGDGQKGPTNKTVRTKAEPTVADAPKSMKTREIFSLEESLSATYRNNPELLGARERLKATSEGLTQAYAGFMPSAAGSFSATRENQKIGARREEFISPERRTLSVSQPIFNGGESFYRVKAARARLDAEYATLTRQEQLTLSEAVVAYMDVVNTKKVLEISKNNEKVLGEQLSATRSRFKLGETTKTDVAQSESRLSRAVSDRIAADGRYIAAKAEFKKVVGIDAPDNVEMPVHLPELPTSEDELLSQALVHNPNLRTAKLLEETAKQNVKVSRSALLPDVSLQASKDDSNGLSSFSGGSQETEAVMLSVNVPLFQSGAEYSRIREAKRTASEATFTTKSAENSVYESVTKAWKDLETSRATVKATSDAVRAARVALEGVRQEQQVGSRTILDVLDAEQEMFVAQVNLVGAQRNEVVATYNVLASMGELTADNLKLDVDVHDATAYPDSHKFMFIGY